MTICGDIIWFDTMPRAYVSGSVRSTAGAWCQFLFRVDTGADITCLPAAAMPLLAEVSYLQAGAGIMAFWGDYSRSISQGHASI